MWHGEQPPGGERNQQGQGQHQAPGQPPGQGQNPYQQPGYQQPHPYGQQDRWNAPTMPAGPQGAAPEPPPGGKGGGDRTKLIALVTAGAVVVAAGVTGFLLLGGDKDDSAGPDPAKSGAAADPAASEAPNPRTGDGMPEPTVPGWKVVVNPKVGIAFDVPAQWSLESRDWAGGVVDNRDAEDESAPFLAAYAAPAYFKEKWCVSDEDKDGIKDDTPLAAAGTRGGRGMKSTRQFARHDATNWVYGVYTQPDRKTVTTGPTESYTTKSGVKGSLVKASSSGVEKQGKCESDGKATVFAFKDQEGRFVSWSFHGAKGVKDELPDATVEKILATVRLYEPVQD